MEILTEYTAECLYAGFVCQAFLLSYFRRTRNRIFAFLIVQNLLGLSILVYGGQIPHFPGRRGYYHNTVSWDDPAAWNWWLIWAVFWLGFFLRLGSSKRQTK